MKFKEIKRKRIYEEVLVQLQEYLLNGDVVPGQKLPSERELAQTFNVNRVSVREALTVLEANGLVERKVGEGTFRTGAVNFEATPLIKAITNKERQVREPIQVRRVIEPQLARLAAQNISDEQLETLRDILRRQEERLKQGKDIIDLDSEFHYAIARATNNSIFVGLLEALDNSLVSTRVTSNMAQGGGQRGYAAHKSIFEALKKRDPDKAEEAMFNHIMGVERMMLHYFAEQEPVR